MASIFFPSLAAIAFAAMLFYLFLNRRSRQINGGEAKINPAANDGTAGAASSTHTSTEGQGIATSLGYDYEVFLNFRGSDTRAGFTDFLYNSLKDAGIRVFKDDEELPVGKELGPKLLQAINQSKISIPIFSKDYASSVWCLKELVQMVECKKIGRQKIMPIFYDVAPSEVRYQTGDYEKAFCKHKKKRRYGQETISQWKDALRVVGAISGWDLHSEGANRQEGFFAKTVTQNVFNELKKAYLEVSNCLVSVDDQVDKIMEMIGAQTSETRIIGIYGMGGIGKTTIAKIIYNQLSEEFEIFCFLPDIRETSKGKGIQCLQTRLLCDILKIEHLDIKDIYEGARIIKDRLSSKRVLLFLDDVGEDNHMNALVGKRDWFGKGSKLIITTRKRDVLNVPEVDYAYEVNGMDDRQSLQLFSKHAFRRDYPLDGYINQSKRAIKIAGGLPLALEIIGSLLSRIEKEKWNAKLEKLEDVPLANVQSKLRISYDALEVQQRYIFLDIACLLIGHDKEIMVYFWDFKFHPKDAMDVLESMSLIKIKEDNKVWMHDQLRDLGRQIVREESNMEIKKQSRVWNPEEALDLLRIHEGRKKVQALRLKFDHEGQYRFTYEGFMELSNLRYLVIDGRKTDFFAEASLLWHESPSNVSNLLPQLRWLSWHDIPPQFKITNFFMENVVILDLSWSEITDDWEGWRYMKGMKKLKVLDLSNCFHLKRTPNFSTFTNLERLILYRCVSIVEVDGSIRHLNRLVSLEARHCLNLQRLPDELDGCLASLEYLSLKNCRSLKRLPDTIGNLKLLSELNISGTSIKELPDSIGKLKNLKVVKMQENNISKIPDAFWTFEKLEEIDAHKNYDIERFLVNIDNCIYKNQSLRILKLKSADICKLPRLPESLIELKLWELNVDTFPDLSNLTNLKVLDLSFGGPDDDVKSNGLVEDPMPQWIGTFSKLESLALRSPYVTTSPTDLTLPPHLKSLHLRCPNMRCLPRLPSSLSSLCLQFCYSLRSVEDLSNLKKLSTLEIWHGAISEIPGLGCLGNLRDLKLWRLGQVEILPDLSKLKKLRRLRVAWCDNLKEIQGELPKSLEMLKITYCESFQKLPDLSSLNELQMVGTNDCAKLNVEAISRLCSEKSIKFLR